MLRVGITGGIGSGKTTVANLFANLGVPVIDSDEIAHSLLDPGEESYNSVVKIFGKIILRPDKSIDRARLREIVFTDAGSKIIIEDILHPEVRKKILGDIKQITSPYCIVVVPLLIEANFLDTVDRVLVIDADEAIRITRVMKRSGMSREEILKIISLQSSRNERLEIADDVIQNNDNESSIIQQVEDLHKIYTALSLQAS